MFSPDESYGIEPNSAVMTVGGMEQLGHEFGAFLQYLLKESPEICVHIEPIYELYDQDTLSDYLAARYSDRVAELQKLLAEARKLDVTKRPKDLTAAPRGNLNWRNT